MRYFLEYVEIVQGYRGTFLIFVLAAIFSWVLGNLWATGSGATEDPWYLSVIVFLLCSPLIGYRAWLDERHAREKEVQNLTDEHQQQIKNLEHVLTATKTPTHEEIVSALKDSIANEKVTSYDVEGNAIVLTLPSPPVPDTVDLFITNGHYNRLTSPGMSIQGNKIYLKNVDKPRELQFFDVLPLEIPEGSVRVRYYPASPEEDTRARRREQRETLARFITKGVQVRQTYETLVPQTNTAAKEWDNEVCGYLHRTFGYDYAVLFQGPIGPDKYNLDECPSHITPKNYLFYLFFKMRFDRLRKLIEELKD